MTRVLYTDNLADHENLGSFDTDSFHLSTITAKSLVFSDGNGTKMVLHGSGIDKDGNAVTGGTIKSATFFDASGTKLYTFKDVEASAVDIYKAESLDHNPNRVMHGLMQGDDQVTGSKADDSLWGFYGDDVLDGKLGDDMLFGHQGNDTLTGGEGADSFALTAGCDMDVVTDFDVSGADHDFIYMDYYLYDSLTYTRQGRDLVLTLATGDELILDHVKKSDLTPDHFHFF